MSSSDNTIVIKKAVQVDFDKGEEVSAEEVDGQLAKISTNMLDVTRTVENAVGEVLTIIDGCITDKEQKKAIKSMIKNAMYDICDTLHAYAENDCEEEA